MGRGRAVQGYGNGQHRGMWGCVGSGLMRTLAVVAISVSAVPIIAVIFVIFLAVVTVTISAILVSPWSRTSRLRATYRRSGERERSRVSRRSRS